MLHPLMLAWLAGAAVPLVLHLLSRSQFRAVPWGAMMFLTGMDAGPRQSARLKLWSLLLLRMALVGLLAIALARPVIAARYGWVPTAGLTTGGPASVVIILDDSAGMGYQQNGQSRLDQARQVTLQILSSLKRGDEAALLLAGTRDYQPPLPPSADLQSIAGRVADLQPDTGAPDFAPDLLRAADLLEHVIPANREIYLICDHQALGWRNLTDGFGRQWRAHQQSGPAPRVTVIPVGGDESDNLAVDAIDFPQRAALRDQQTFAQVRIRNYGPAAQTTVPLSVWTGTHTLAELSLSVAAHGIRTINVPVRFGETGSHVISAAIQSTGLTTDDRLDCSVDVLDPPRVLLITANGSPTTQPADNTNSQLWLSRKSSENLIAVSVKSFSPPSLKTVSQVILQNVARFSPEQLRSLADFASTGGSVLILPGPNTTADDYNQCLLSSRGIFRALLGQPAARTDPLAAFSSRSSPVRFLLDQLESSAPQPAFHYFHLTTPEPILARHSENQPALVESTTGRGRILFVNAIVDPRQPPAGAEPLLQALLRYLATASAVDRNLAQGQPIVAVTTDPVDERSATVQFLSGGSREPAVVSHPSSQTEIRYNRTNRPGTYRLRYRSAGKEKVLNYIVLPSHAGSDLTPLTDDQWAALHERLRFSRVDLTSTTVAQAMDVQRGGREIWIELIAAVLALMTLEMLLSRWWSLG